ncbi:hypothetical protein Q9L58_007291 [Maublancomyces gigas]|uniref:Uncharacterized protein n=1 Tax=Discina gigas TaxID=1032678 RepID=A0ABR3GCW4_9PEZI
MFTESTEAHIASIESLILALQPLVEEMQSMMRWVDSSVKNGLGIIKFHLLSAENYTGLIENIKSSNSIRLPTLSTQQKQKLDELMIVVMEMQDDMDEAVKELKFIVEQHEKVE